MKKASTIKRKPKPEPVNVEQVILEHARLIHKMAWGCQQRMPPSVVYPETDLFQEGVLEILKAEKYFTRRRGKLTTFLTVVLRNRYLRLMKKEWKRYNVVDQRITSHEIECLNSQPASRAARRSVRPSAISAYRTEITIRQRF